MAFRIFNFSDNGQNVTPVEALGRKFARAFKGMFDPETGTQPISAPKESASFTDPTVDYGGMSIVPHQWKVAQDRKAMYKDIENMDRNDELVSTALDITATNAVDYIQNEDDGTTVRFRFRSKNKEVENILTDMQYRLDLDDIAYQLARDLPAHGSVFREPVIDQSVPQLMLLKQTIPYHIWPKTNEKGDKLPGWIVKVEADVYSGGGCELAEWQILPFIFGAKRGYLSIPPLASARAGFQRLQKMEDGMAVARLVRAYDKLVHHIPVEKTQSASEMKMALRNYKDAITKRKLETTDGQMNQLDNPLDVQTDFYILDDGSKRGGVDLLSSNNAQLGNLNDVYFGREKLLARLRVPVSLLQIQSSMKTHLKSTGGGSSDIEIQWNKYLRSIQAVIRRGFSRLADMELQLHGISPMRGLYTIEFAPLSTEDPMEDAQIMLTMGQAAVYFMEAFGALPPELIAAKFFTLTTDQQNIMDKFLTTNSKTILDARITALKNQAVAPLAKAMPRGIGEATVAPGSGNSNKSRAARSSEQKGGAKQDMVSIGEIADIFISLQQSINTELQEVGILAPDVDDLYKQVIYKNLKDIAIC